MIKVAICDDEHSATKEIERLFLAYKKKTGINIELEIFYSGKALEQSLIQGNRYDVICLDIEMGDQDGLLTASNIRALDEKVLLIYISAHEQYIEDIFDVTPFRFIRKPINSDKFNAVVEMAYKKLNESNKYFVFTHKKEHKKIRMDDIMYFESSGRLVVISLRNGQKEFFTGKINDLDVEMRERKIPFLRIHQSFLVNFSAITRKRYTEVYVANGECLYISRGRQRTIDEEYCRILGGEISGDD